MLPVSVNVQHTEQNALLYRAYTKYSGAEVSHTNRCLGTEDTEVLGGLREPSEIKVKFYDMQNT